MGVVSRKNQVTIPVEALSAAGIRAGDDLRVRSVAPGRIELSRVEDLLDEFAGSMTDDVFPPGYLDDLRRGWE